MGKNIAQTVGVVLCGGRSSRMGGGDKCLLPFGDTTILHRVVQRLQPQVRTMSINANSEPSRFSAYGVPVLDDGVPGFAGPLAGVLSGMRWAAGFPGCDSLLSVAGDTPFFPGNLAGRLAESASQAPGLIAVATSGGRRHPVFALWPISLADRLEHFLSAEGNRRVNAFIDTQGVVEVDFPMGTGAGGPLDPFFNINTPEDLAEAWRISEKLEP
jgi:molybdopterin-guanine dinucleotide biosynthesis protein A